MKKLIFLLLVLTIGFSCSDELTDLNIDTQNPSVVPSSSLVANAQVALMDYVVDQNVNRNNFRLWAQMWSQTTYPDESNYQLVERNVNGFAYARLYSTVLKDLNEARAYMVNIPEISEAEITANEAVITVLEVFTYAMLVDIFGDIIYYEALDIEKPTPAYTDDKEVYYELIEKLDSALPNLTGNTLGLGDVIYNGNLGAWSKMANSLKLRMAIRIADSDAAKAQTLVTEAVTAGVFTSPADNFKMSYIESTPHTHPLWVTLIQSGRSDYVASNTIGDYMNALEDPRRPYYFKDTGANDTIVGGIFGSSNSYTPNSKPGWIQEQKTSTGVALSFVEVEFLLADAAERGFITTPAADHYHNGIETSIRNWTSAYNDVISNVIKVDSMKVDNDSLNTLVNDYLANVNVNYATAPGSWKEKIAMQKWLALYDEAFEAWSTYRLYDAPVMNVATGAGTTPPSRFTYPFSEYTLNETNVKAAGSAMGGDDLFSKVFWDVN